MKESSWLHPSQPRWKRVLAFAILLVFCEGCVAIIIVIVASVLQTNPEPANPVSSTQKTNSDEQHKQLLQAERKVFHSYLKAAEGGDAKAQFRLALLYQNGQGVRRNSGEAFQWAKKSADQGNAAAQTLLGIMYEGGVGVSQDDTAAAAAYQKAAEQAYPSAESLLGDMYLEGRGVEQSNVQAYIWFLRADTDGDENAKDQMDLVSGLLNPQQIQQAKSLAKER